MEADTAADWRGIRRRRLGCSGIGSWLLSPRVAVNHDGQGGTALTPLFEIREKGSSNAMSRLMCMKIPTLRIFRVGLGLRSVVDASRVLMLRPGLKSVDLFCRFSSFLCTLHWPADAGELGHHGVSYLEVLMLYGQWAGHRLLSEKVTRPRVRALRLFFYFFRPCFGRN